MTRPTFSTSVLVFFVALICAGCGPDPEPGTYTGYVEAEYVFVAAPQSGWLASAGIQEGSNVQTGDLLFELDADLQEAELAEANAQLHEAKASLKLAEAEVTRNSPLLRQGAISQARFDDIETAFEQAEAALENAEARVARADYQLSQRRKTAPRPASVEEVFYRNGEFVSAGSPIYALLPADGLKVRFFIPQADLSNVEPGQGVEVKADGLIEPVSAEIFFVAREAEFTPPIIYSEDTRDKLVFLVEARVDDKARLRAGQPVTVRLQ